MDTEITDDGKVKIGMKEYILEAIDMFGEDVPWPVTSAAKHYCMKVHYYYEKLSE